MSDEKVKIIIVEDYDDTREMVAEALKGSNYELTLCADGRCAVAKYVETMHCSPHAGMLVDLMLPDINGLRVMSGIREFEKGSIDCEPIRLGLMTASGDIVNDLEVLDSLGITLRLDKPFDIPVERGLEYLAEQIDAWIKSPPGQGPSETLCHREETVSH